MLNQIGKIDPVIRDLTALVVAVVAAARAFGLI